MSGREAGAATIFLATPCFGGQVNQVYMRSVLDLQAACAARGVGLQVELMGGEALITRGRSRLAAKFLASGASHLLFVDADIGFRPENAFRLLAADKDVVGGVYPVKRIDWDKARAAARAGAADIQAAATPYVVRFRPEAGSVDVAGGFAQVAYVGTGFMMIRRQAMQRIVEAHPELTAKMADLGDATSAVTMVFDTMIEPGTGQHLSEDYAFCRRWQDLGGTIWADLEAPLTHVGHTAYTGAALQAMTSGGAGPA